jgi:hypothetical protein
MASELFEKYVVFDNTVWLCRSEITLPVARKMHPASEFEG